MISKSASDKKNCAMKALFTNSARSAFTHIIRSLSNTKRQKVLLPAYIGFTEREGSGVFDPVTENASDYAFYKVKDDLSVDLDDFKKQLVNQVDIALIIHYFGFCRSDLIMIKQLCVDAKVILVEDCAHAFHLESSDSILGRIGDFSFYSLHKYIAVESGGILKLNNNKLLIPEVAAQDQADRDVVEQYALTDFDAIKEIRRRNYSLYARLLKSLDQIEIMFYLNNEDIPQTFPIRVKNFMREKLYFYLMERNIPTTALYYRMIDEIDASAYPTSFAISSEILNLPVHQDTTEEDVEYLCKEVNKFFNKKE
ncbi:MAG: DegT/DnrJ/EryC1/StrS family aminotransferase [Desulfuromonadaceae bacterium]|nr:DegT/DnrJ/EryC1/StrS family aminotransferase [Desulfuromonadaceae bacterium]